MDSLAGRVEPLCDVCNRNQYPCHCRLAKDDVIIGCKYFIRAIAPKIVRRKPQKTGIGPEYRSDDLQISE